MDPELEALIAKEETSDEDVEEVEDETEETKTDDELSDADLTVKDDVDETKEDEEKSDEETDEKETKDEEVQPQELSLANLTKVYPKISEQFPSIQNVLRFVSEAEDAGFDSVEKLTEASETIHGATLLQNELLRGNTEFFLAGLARTDRHAAATVIDNFLPAVLKVGGEAFVRRAVDPIIASLLRKGIKDGELHDNKIMVASLRNASRVLFGRPDPPELAFGRQIAVEEKQEQRGPSKAEMRLAQLFVNGVESKVNALIDSDINEVLGKLPVSKFVKSQIREKVHSELDRIFQSDELFVERYKKVFAEAARANFDDRFTQRAVALSKEKYGSAFVRVMKKIIAEAVPRKTEKDGKLRLLKPNPKEDKKVTEQKVAKDKLKVPSSENTRDLAKFFGT